MLMFKISTGIPFKLQNEEGHKKTQKQCIKYLSLRQQDSKKNKFQVSSDISLVA